MHWILQGRVSWKGTVKTFYYVVSNKCCITFQTPVMSLSGKKQTPKRSSSPVNTPASKKSRILEKPTPKATATPKQHDKPVSHQKVHCLIFGHVINGGCKVPVRSSVSVILSFIVYSFLLVNLAMFGWSLKHIFKKLLLYTVLSLKYIDTPVKVPPNLEGKYMWCLVLWKAFLQTCLLLSLEQLRDSLFST